MNTFIDEALAEKLPVIVDVFMLDSLCYE